MTFSIGVTGSTLTDMASVNTGDNNRKRQTMTVLNTVLLTMVIWNDVSNSHVVHLWNNRWNMQCSARFMKHYPIYVTWTVNTNKSESGVTDIFVERFGTYTVQSSLTVPENSTVSCTINNITTVLHPLGKYSSYDHILIVRA